jgi:hypothetical protein
MLEPNNQIKYSCKNGRDATAIARTHKDLTTKKNQGFSAICSRASFDPDVEIVMVAATPYGAHEGT